MKTVKSVWIFDLDGVIIDPQEKRITQPEILSQIIRKLETGELVALNTGRSVVWMINQVINPLSETIKNKKILQNFFASGEKGGTWITFEKNGEMQHHKDESISVPKFLQDKVRNIINSEFSESMFLDETKETMISVEMNDRFDIKKYSQRQKILNEKLQKFINENSSSETLKINPTIIATDIENKHVGKGFAMGRILNWLKEKSVVPQKIICFGDSKSDFEMAQKAHDQGFETEFVYVGGDNAFENIKTEIPIIIPKNKFEKGTLEYLQFL